jgi:hypothetical protein
MVKGTNRVDVAEILFENDDGDQSSFMEAVRDQYINEVMSFCRDIYTSLNAADTRKMGNIPAGQVCVCVRPTFPISH